MGGGAWPFLVGGVICQVNSDNERDFSGRDVSCFFIEEGDGYFRWIGK